MQRIVNNKLRFRIQWVIAVWFLLLGCNPKVPSTLEGTSDNSSRLPVATESDNNPKDVAYCNKKESSKFTAQLKIFYDQTGTYHPEFLRLYIPTITSSFSDKGYQLVLRKWKASLQGETYQEDTPLRVRVERIGDHKPMTNYMDAIHWNSISTELDRITGSTIKMSDAFTSYSFVVDLKDLSGTYDVLKISLYKDGSWKEDMNILIPAFYAHPKTYAAVQNGVLANLHPFYGSESSSFSGEHFASVLNSYCF